MNVFKDRSTESTENKLSAQNTEFQSTAQQAIPGDSVIPAHGSLEKNLFPELLRILWVTKTSGILSCQKNGINKTIYFKDGSPAYAVSNAEEDSLSSILLKNGKINKDHYSDILENKKRTGGIEKGLLLKLGYVKLEELPIIIKQQIEIIILSLFSWETGEFTCAPLA